MTRLLRIDLQRHRQEAYLIQDYYTTTIIIELYFIVKRLGLGLGLGLGTGIGYWDLGMRNGEWGMGKWEMGKWENRK